MYTFLSLDFILYNLRSESCQKELESVPETPAAGMLMSSEHSNVHKSNERKVGERIGLKHT